MAKKASRDLLTQAFGLLAEQGWQNFSFTALAERAGLPLDAVYKAFPDRPAILRALGRHLDAAMLALPQDELAELNPRERLFEIIMKRLDAMAPFKPGMARLGDDARRAPDLLLPTLGNLARATSWLVDVAGGELKGWQRAAGQQLVGALYVRVFNVWLHDDTEDHARTMAELDKRLQQLERLAGWAQRGPAFFGRRRPADDAGKAA